MKTDNQRRFFEAFHTLHHVFIVAIHVVPSPADTDRDIQVAFEGGADGIVLIRDYNTLANNDDVMQTYRVARRRYPTHWIGINLLGVHPAEAVMAIPHGTSGLWFDNAHISENDSGSGIYLQRVWSTSDVYHLPNPPLIMPSIAFKYQAPVKDYAKVVRLAQPHADALVTSGTATGEAPDAEKIRIMCEAANIPLGIASGTSIDNVETFMRLGVTFFIVNTKISDPTTGRLDPAKVKELRAAIPRH